jgi:hypothetical protein
MMRWQLISGGCPSNHHELLSGGCFVRASRDSVCVVWMMSKVEPVNLFVGLCNAMEPGSPGP